MNTELFSYQGTEIEFLPTVQNEAMPYDTLLCPVFDDCEEEMEEMEEEPDGFECMACGNIQGVKNGFGCNRCAGPLREWFC